MKKWFYRLIWIPVLVVAVLFLVANRMPVAISLDPFNADNPAMSTAALPLWFWLMAMLFTGVGLGALGMWLSGGERRSQARDNRRELKAAKKELAAMTARAEAAEKSAAAPAGEPENPHEPPKLEATNL
ncbi:LapA family protein [Hyphococcus sp.]|uniref:LapA family protein n=1 Tax=Hyphococcus sp. TaxID=2038636 RepID=UPI003CCBCD46